MAGKILITGASRGLGHDLSAIYLKMGFRVYACARDINGQKLDLLKKAYGDYLQSVEMDIGDTASVQKAAEIIKNSTDNLDIIINNAAMHADDSYKVLEEMNVDNCIESFNINTLGALRVARELAGLLENGNMRTLVNISSESGSIANCHRDREFDYCMSKAALNMQSVILQNYLKSRNIKVLALHPGWFRSDMGGPNADFAVMEAAEGVADLIEKFRGDLNGPIFIDYKGNVMEY